MYVSDLAGSEALVFEVHTYIYIYMYVYIYIYVCMYIYIYIWVQELESLYLLVEDSMVSVFLPEP